MCDIESPLYGCRDREFLFVGTLPTYRSAVQEATGFCLQLVQGEDDLCLGRLLRHLRDLLLFLLKLEHVNRVHGLCVHEVHSLVRPDIAFPTAVLEWTVAALPVKFPVVGSVGYLMLGRILLNRLELRNRLLCDLRHSRDEEFKILPGVLVLDKQDRFVHASGLKLVGVQVELNLHHVRIVRIREWRLLRRLRLLNHRLVMLERKVIDALVFQEPEFVNGVLNDAINMSEHGPSADGAAGDFHFPI